MKIKEKNFVSVVIYIHNAEQRIEDFLRMIIKIFNENFEKSEIICVNDYSEDESEAAIRQVCKNTENITVTILNMSYFHGLENAMNAGRDLSIGDFVFEFDSTVRDFKDEEIMKIYEKALEGYDIVNASPREKLKLSSRLFYVLFEKFTDFSFKIYTEKFRILSRRAINRVSNMNSCVPYRKVAYANCGLKTIGIKYDILPFNKHEKLDLKERKYRRRLAVDVMILYSEMGYRFAVYMSFLMMLIAIGMGLYSLTVYFMSSPVAGWTTTILFLALAFFGLFGMLAIVIKYLQILVEMIFSRKKYNFESIEKLTK